MSLAEGMKYLMISKRVESSFMDFDEKMTLI